MGRRNTGKTAARTALAGMFSALSVVVLFLGYATGVLDLCAVAVTSMFIAVSMIELGGAYPYLVWAVTSVISLVILPDKLFALEYILFGGIYPILKLYFERIRRRWLEWVVKLAYAAAVLAVLYAMSRFVLGLPMETGVLAWALLVSYVVFFAAFDRSLTVTLTWYVIKIRPKLTFLKKLR